jgi:hypothetical protein
MNSDVSIVNWKRITKGLPSGKSTANDRALAIEEIQQICEYPERRINKKTQWQAKLGQPSCEPSQQVL